MAAFAAAPLSWPCNQRNDNQIKLPEIITYSAEYEVKPIDMA
jgi:hypothetical protein